LENHFPGKQHVFPGGNDVLLAVSTLYREGTEFTVSTGGVSPENGFTVRKEVFPPGRPPYRRKPALPTG
jgi:hypothetical protein